MALQEMTREMASYLDSGVPPAPQPIATMAAPITPLDAETRAGAAALYGAMLGLERVAYDGDMSVTGMTIDMALALFMDDVLVEGGAEAADTYARLLQKTLQRYRRG